MIYILKILSEHVFLIKLSISILFIYLLFNKFLEANSFDLVRNIEPGTILICLGLTILSLLFKSLRWKAIIEMMGGKIDFLNLVDLYLVGFYYGSISPGRAGEFIKGSRLSKNGLQTKEGLISVLYERFYDITTPIAFVGMYFVTNTVLKGGASEILFLLGTFSISIALWLGLIYVFQFFKNKIRLLSNVASVSLAISSRYVLIPATASILNWACIGLTAYILLGAFGVNIAFSRVIFAVCIAMLSILLPVTVSGWGIREAAYVWALSPFVEPAVSIVFSITFSFIGTYSLALLGLLCEMRIKGSKSP